jgi:hypothetical protein
LTSVVNALEEEHGLVKVLLDNLTHYCGAVKAKTTTEPSLANESDRKKLFIAGTKYSHHTEVEERL